MRLQPVTVISILALLCSRVVFRYVKQRYVIVETANGYQNIKVWSMNRRQGSRGNLFLSESEQDEQCLERLNKLCPIG